MSKAAIIAVLCVVLVALTCDAGNRTSGSYSITTEAVDAGGRRVTSPTYRIEGSVGEAGGMSGAPGGDTVMKSGFAGQLYDVTGFLVHAAPLTIEEGASKQINASRTVDDGTLLALNPAAVAWSVQSGPLTSISGTGVATAGVVYQNTSAQVQGSFENKTSLLALTVQNSAPDNYGSYAGDQIDDDWQIQYFGENNPAAGPQEDPDGDGQVNLFEFTAGVVPTSAASSFKLEITTVPGQPTHRNLVFSPRLPDRTYVAQARLSMTAAWEPLAPAAQSDNGDQRTVTDLRAIESTKFYRIQITKP